jgi:wyosine [tRNA(Phe)-imidazoG37] synthetase (radical SAM superfamily)
MKYIYGPVKSRRLGLSLGITLTPYKICSFNCVYCQLGETFQPTKERKEYLLVQDIFNEFKGWLETNSTEAEKINYITLSGSGEPTLNLEIGQLITEIKKITSIPVAVITNASLLGDPLVRQAVAGADLIIPSLDAVTLEIFEKTNQPASGIKIEEVINGLFSLRKEFSGEIWLEVMLIKGINDDLRQIKRLKDIVDKINPHKVQLNSPVRVTAKPGIFPVDKNKLQKIKEILGDKCQII